MKPLIALLLLATSLPATMADCNNGNRERCGAPGYHECVAKINGTCPTVCEGTACFPDNDCILSAHSLCTFTCCTFTDRPGCEACAEAAGMVADAMCDAIDCQYQFEDLKDVLDTIEYVWPVITHDEK
ncbi:hypothetical protein FE257_003290 [Aspergillus nanangensis]|uniref:Uncharacterized protein n=1 Tax=Aspergillus nanangensis TaxID=2582783 RepID=A0AAD4GVK3_ASPNN|nr:hypothetical protein FE257_003290 [Aspergillus nanangensis]